MWLAGILGKVCSSSPTLWIRIVDKYHTELRGRPPERAAPPAHRNVSLQLENVHSCWLGHFSFDAYSLSANHLLPWHFTICLFTCGYLIGCIYLRFMLHQSSELGLHCMTCKNQKPSPPHKKKSTATTTTSSCLAFKWTIVWLLFSVISSEGLFWL